MDDYTLTGNLTENGIEAQQNPHVLLGNLLDEIGGDLPLPVRTMARAFLLQLSEGDAWRVVRAIQAFTQAVMEGRGQDAFNEVAEEYPEVGPFLAMVNPVALVQKVAGHALDTQA